MLGKRERWPWLLQAMAAVTDAIDTSDLQFGAISSFAILACWVEVGPLAYFWRNSFPLTSAALGDHKLMLEARRDAWWDANKIGMSPHCAAG
jgi:hypothetical protein